MQDIAYAVRTFRKAPAFSVAALCALALGVGANTAIFSVVNAVLIRPLPYPDADRLVMVFNTSLNGPWPIDWATRFDAVRQQTDVFEESAAYRLVGVNVAGGPEPEHVLSWQVSSDFFKLFGAPIAMGRTFTPDEEDLHGAHVAVLSHGLWQRRFGGDLHVLDRTIVLNDVPYVIIGVLGPRFDTASLPYSGGFVPDLWTPLQFDPTGADRLHYLLAVARLKSGISVRRAQAGLQGAGDLSRPADRVR